MRRLTLPEIEQSTTAPEIDEDEICKNIVTGWNHSALYLNSPTEYRAYYRPPDRSFSVFDAFCGIDLFVITSIKIQR